MGTWKVPQNLWASDENKGQWESARKRSSMSGLFITSTQLLLCEVGMNDGSLFSECYKYLQHRQYLMSVGKV